MKYLDKAGVQRLWQAVTTRIDASPSGGGAMASWFDLNNVADSYDCGGEADIAAFLNATLNTAVRQQMYHLATLKPLTVTVGAYEWSDRDASYTRRAAADVHINFPDGSRLTAPGVTFTRADYSGLLLVRLGTPTSCIDTGLTQDYSYEFRVQGCVPSSNQGVLVGAFTSTTDRTELRLLGSSNKAQHMWYANNVIDSAVSKINYRNLFFYTQNGDGITFAQGATTYNQTYANTQKSGAGAAKICLLNNSDGGNYGYGHLASAEIRDGAGTVLRHFEPRYVEGELVMVDTANGNQIYRPNTGGLVEATA